MSFRRDQLTNLQRARVLVAVTGIVAEQGVPAATVTRAVERAGVSRRTFYEIFTDANDCLAAAMEHAYGQARDLVLSEYDPEAPWTQRIRTGLVALLSFLEDEPPMARLLIVESLGAGTGILERRSTVLAEIAREIDRGRSEVNDGSHLPSVMAEGVVGAVHSVLHARLLAGSPKPPVELAGQLMSMIVLPYMGSAAARRELGTPISKRVSRAPSDERPRPSQRFPMRVTHRTICVLQAIDAQPGSSNREIGEAAGISDQGQISRLLSRLRQVGLLDNTSAKDGMLNAWTLTSQGRQVVQTIRMHSEGRRRGSNER